MTLIMTLRVDSEQSVFVYELVFESSFVKYIIIQTII